MFRIGIKNPLSMYFHYISITNIYSKYFLDPNTPYAVLFSLMNTILVKLNAYTIKLGLHFLDVANPHNKELR